MSSPCDNCPFDEKLLLCCPRHPLTGEQKYLLVDGKHMRACIYLDADGLCEKYDERPKGCRDFVCDRFSNETKAFFK
jgi:Fe-S-cluster containining protein